MPTAASIPTSVVSAMPEASMTGGLTRERVQELFEWMEREGLVWMVVSEQFESQLTRTVGPGIAVRLWHWACIEKRLTADDVQSSIPESRDALELAFARLRKKRRDLMHGGERDDEH